MDIQARPPEMLERQMQANRNAARYRNPETGRQNFPSAALPAVLRPGNAGDVARASTSEARVRYLQIRIAVPEDVPAERAILYTFAEMMRDVAQIRDPSKLHKYRSVIGLREGNVMATAAWVKLPKAINA